MNKRNFMQTVGRLYNAMNLADGERAPEWMRHEMAGSAGCALLDEMLSRMVQAGALTEEDRKSFYDNR